MGALCVKTGAYCLGTELGHFRGHPRRGQFFIVLHLFYSPSIVFKAKEGLCTPRVCSMGQGPFVNNISLPAGREALSILREIHT